MDVRWIPRTAVDGYVRLARRPLDAALGLVDRNGAGTIAVDRVDATVRAIAGAALRDDRLREDATRRREAANERERALRLAAEAELRGQRGADEAVEHRQEAQRTRREAAG